MAFSLRLIFILTFLGTVAHAAISGEAQVNGGSGRTRLSGSNWRVYASFAGPQNNQATEPYNNCNVALGSEANFVGCNLKRVNGDMPLTVTFRESQTFTAPRMVIAYIRSSDTVNPVTIPNLVATPQPGPNYIAQLSWRAICEAAGGRIEPYTAAVTRLGGTLTADACMSGSEPMNKTIQLIVGVQGDSGITAVSEVLIEVRFATPKFDIGLFNPDTTGATPQEGSDGFQPSVHGCNIHNGADTGTEDTSPEGSQYTGFCDYKLQPGDEKIRIVSNPTIANNLNLYPSTDGTIYAGFILFLSNTDFATTLPWNKEGEVINYFRNKGVAASGFEKSDLESSIIKNDRPVFTRMATLDEANNVTHLFSNNLLDANCGPPPADSDPNFFRYFVGTVDRETQTPPFLDRCPYATVPSLVTGLLEKDINCFVATALMGSPYHHEVMTLREFRNRFLKSFVLGRTFIEFYYDKGPIAAKWLDQNPQYKPFFRVVLWPIYVVANIFNTFGALIGLVFTFTLLLLPFAAWNLQRKTFFHR